MVDASLKAGVVNDLVLLSCVGIRPVLVHGGGPEINGWLKKLSIEAEFKNGLRVTDGTRRFFFPAPPPFFLFPSRRGGGGTRFFFPSLSLPPPSLPLIKHHLSAPPHPHPPTHTPHTGPTMDVVEMVLCGRVNKGLVTLIQQAGGSAVGLCGKDAGLIAARQMVERDIGFVGDITSVAPALLRTLVESGYIPVVASVAADSRGQGLNVNADIAAGEIAAALSAEKLILMTDVPGVLRDKDDVSTKFAELSIADTRSLVGDGVIAGGMIPKVECCVRCLAQGVRAAHIIDGRAKHSLLMELLTDEGVGTMITG